MNRPAGALTTLLLGAALPAGAGLPALRVGVTCDTPGAVAGTTVTVPIALEAGTRDDGQPNAIAAVDLVTTFDAGALTPADVRLPEPLAASGRWMVDWERTLGLPESPGRATIALAPTFGQPVAALPDGPIVELVLRVHPDAHGPCVPIAIDPASVVLSTLPLGLPIAPGAIASGGLALRAPTGESCRNCADDDGDGRIDLSDPDCGASVATFDGRRDVLAVKRRRGGDLVVALRATLPAAFRDLSGPLRVELRPSHGGAPRCAGSDAELVKRSETGDTRTYLFASGGTEVARLVSHLGNGRSTLVAELAGLEVDDVASALALSIWLGSAPFQADVQLVRNTRNGRVYR